jgi:polyphosphate kinase
VNPAARNELRNVLELSMSDGGDSWDLAGDGTWTRRVSHHAKPLVHLQASLLRRVIGKTG